MSKKSIEKLFQEKFEDFREHPDDKVWDRIKATLDNHKGSRDMIPIWWKLGAVAAGLALLFYLMVPFKSSDQELPTITNTEKEDSPAVEKQLETIDPVITDVDNKNAIKKKAEEGTDIEDLNHGKENGRAVVSSDITTKKEGSDAGKKERERSYKAPSSAQAPFGEEAQWTSQEKSGSENGSNPNVDRNSDKFDPADKLAQNDLKNPEDINKGQTENSEIGSLIPQNTADTTAAVVAVDSLETSKKKSILEVLDDTDESQIATGKKERWSVEPSIAPIYFNAAGEGSPIAPSFVSNSRSGEVSLSYGVLVSYEIGKKLRIRSGLQKVSYGYNTNNISYTSAFGVVSMAHIDNIDYKMNSESLAVQNQKQGKPIPGLAMDASAKNPTRTGSMLQQFGYLEVPMEVNYALLDKKFGIDLIGGVSSLFLTDNSVTLESGDRNTELGEANNINSVNFSANIGFGLNYKIMPKVRLNVEPIFKYQLNTFSNTAGSFQPFSIGVYSGLNFKF
jgi:hypothetical protein